jgi:hypothetical protein
MNLAEGDSNLTIPGIIGEYHKSIHLKEGKIL